MKKLKYYTIIFALAVIIAGVFVTNSAVAYAEQSFAPWNVTAEIYYGDEVYRYDLSKQIDGMEFEADIRGFYLGYNGRKNLANGLLKQGLDPICVYQYLLPNFDKILKRFNYVCCDRTDSAVNFSPRGFSYGKSCDGVKIDADKLFEEMISCRGHFKRIALPLKYDRAITAEQLKRNTVLKGKFTTTYYNSGENRCFNIALSAKAIDGITVKSGQTFSFNEVVGARTEANGYKNAKVIMDGGYTDGVGGGVCQTSTTLYNALLLAGLLPKASQHTLVSGYVKAGFDAMVADGVADLTFVNTTNHDLYISAKVSGKTVTFTVYGEPNEYDIVRESVEQRQPFNVVEIVDKTRFPELVYDDQIKVITNGSDGVKTKSYLKYYKNGVLVKTQLIRSNSYKRVDKVIARGAEPRAEQPSALLP